MNREFLEKRLRTILNQLRNLSVNDSRRKDLMEEMKEIKARLSR